MLLARATHPLFDKLPTQTPFDEGMNTSVVDEETLAAE